MKKNLKVLLISILAISLFTTTVLFSSAMQKSTSALDNNSSFFESDNCDLTVSNNFLDLSNRTGIKVELSNLSGKSRASVNYNNYIKKADFAKFLEMGIVPQKEGGAEFGHMVVTLTDSINNNEQISYILSPQPNGTYWETWTTAKVALTDNVEPFNKIKYGGSTCIRIKDTLQSITSLNNLFLPTHAYYEGSYMDCGYNLGKIANWFMLEKGQQSLNSVYFGLGGSFASINNNLIADISSEEFLKTSTNSLKDSIYNEIYSKKNVENLMSSGYAKLSVEFIDLYSDKIVCNFLSVGSQSFESKEFQIAMTSPVIISNLVTNGIKNTKYELPPIKAFDNFVGDISGISGKTFYTVKDETGKNVEIVDNAFTPKSFGKYEIICNAKNLDDKVFSRSYLIEVYNENKYSTININGEFKDRYKCGDILSVWSAQATNLLSLQKNNNIQVNAIIQIDGKVDKFFNAQEVNNYNIIKDGNYKIIYLTTTAFGSIDLVSFDFSVEKYLQIKPEYEIISAISNRIINLPNYSLKNYFDNTGESNLYSAIFVNDVEVYSAKGSEKISGSMAYSVPKNINSLKIAYKVGTSKENYITTYEYVAPILKAEYISDYIIPYDIDGELNSSGITISNYKEHLKFVTNKDKGFAMPNQLIADNLFMRFDVDSSSNNFGYLDVVLKDLYNLSNELKFRFTKNDDKTSYMQINGKGKKYLISGSFTNNESFFNIIYSDTDRVLKNDVGVALTDEITNWNNGAKFNGFERGLVKLSFEVRDVKENGSIILKAIANQSFGSSYIGTNIQKYNDIIMPNIKIDEKEIVHSLKIGLNFKVVKAEAFDVLDCFTDIKVSVIMPNGNMLYDNISCDKDFEVFANVFGKWTIKYTANATNANFKSEKTYVIKVSEKEPPLITIFGKLPSMVKVGTEITIPSGVVTDNFTKDCQLEIYMTCPNGKIYYIKDNKFTFSANGKYTLTYYACDDFNNVSEINYLIKAV